MTFLITLSDVRTYHMLFRLLIQSDFPYNGSTYHIKQFVGIAMFVYSIIKRGCHSTITSYRWYHLHLLALCDQPLCLYIHWQIKWGFFIPRSLNSIIFSKLDKNEWEQSHFSPRKKVTLIELLTKRVVTSSGAR